MNSSGRKFKLVLLIDDDPIINYINKRLIEIHGIAENIVCFVSSQQALEFLKKSVIYPEIIFLDISMPVMDGFDFVQEYESFPDSMKSRTRIVVLSSTEDPDELERINNNKIFSQFLAKPLNIDQLKSL
jgi:CheY-like chemotaxis protein